MRCLVFLCAALVYSVSIAWGQYPDRVWPLGFREAAGMEGFGNALIRFEKDSTIVELADLRMNFEATVAAVSDSLGRLLFYTNGCYVAQGSGDTMWNGAGLNPGVVHDLVCPSYGYITPRGAMALPAPGSPGVYYLLHAGMRFDPDAGWQIGPLYCSIVDMRLANGKGEVTLKNQVLIDADLEPFAAVRHGNGRDWWIVAPEYPGNTYHRLLLSPGGFSAAAIVAGPALACERIGSCAFSPDGARFGRQQSCGLVVFDFDRCAGSFSNPRYAQHPVRAFGGGGIQFDFAGQHVLWSDQLAILSAGIHGGNLEPDTLFDKTTLAGNSWHYLQYGPDGRIYAGGMQRNRFLGVLALDTTLGASWKWKALDLPVWTVRSLPNNPNFKLLDLSESPCDTLGINTGLFVQPDPTGTLLQLFPNPASQQVAYRTDGDITARQIRILDALGRTKLLCALADCPSAGQIDVASLFPGCYLVVLDDCKGRIRTQRLMIFR